MLIVSAYALSLWKARWNSCGGMVALQLVNVKTEVALFSVRAGLATLLVDSDISFFKGIRPYPLPHGPLV